VLHTAFSLLMTTVDFLPQSQSSEWIHSAPLRLEIKHLASEAGLRHAVFTRMGGTSEGRFNSLNVSFAVQDDPSRVSANIEIIRKAIGADRIVAMRQNHGRGAVVFGGDDTWPPGGEPVADILMTKAKGAALMVKVADCQGVTLYDPKGALAVVHCGWRGNVSDILGYAVKQMELRLGAIPSRLMAAISPSLGPCCAEFLEYEKIFPPDFEKYMVGQCHFDLWELSRGQLMKAGLKSKNITVAGICTKCRKDYFFSYRGEGKTGRFCASAMLI